MQLFIITLLVFCLVIPLMAIGVIFGRKALTGSCGGLGKLLGEACMFCDKKDECKTAKNSPPHSH